MYVKRKRGRESICVETWRECVSEYMKRDRESVRLFVRYVCRERGRKRERERERERGVCREIERVCVEM